MITFTEETKLPAADLNANFIDLMILHSGAGADGDVTISSNTSLSRDMYYNNLTINNGIILNPNGYRIFVKGAINCVGTGKIASNGNNAGNGGNSGGGNPGSAGTAGAIAYSSGTLPIPLVGKAGAAPNAYSGGGVQGNGGANGADQAKALGNQHAVAGGTGGSGQRPGYSVFGGGTGGTAGQKTGSILAYPAGFNSAYNLFDVSGGTIAQFGVAPSSGSGGAGAPGNSSGGGTNWYGGAGGGSGSSGGCVWICATTIINLNVEAIGGNGGNGGNGWYVGSTEYSGVGGGGAGGNGGVIIIIYRKATTITTNVAGGTGGTFGSGTGNTVGATNGANGNVGLVYTLALA